LLLKDGYSNNDDIDLVVNDLTEEKQSFQFRMEDTLGTIEVEGEVRGTFRIPGQDDMKLKAVLALLHSVDQENFKKVNELDLFNALIGDIEDTLRHMKAYDRFQGHTIEHK
jgi:hypothetical protein